MFQSSSLLIRYRDSQTKNILNQSVESSSFMEDELTYRLKHDRDHLLQEVTGITQTSFKKQ